MSKELFVIFLDPLNSGELIADWIHVDIKGSEVASGFAEPLTAVGTALQQVSKSVQVVLVLPADKVVATTVIMPLKGGRQMMQALPYMVEEGIAEDIDKMHLAVGVKRLSGKLPVALILKEYLQHTLEVLQNASIQPEAVYSRPQLLSSQPKCLTVAILENECYLVAEHFFTVSEPANLSLVIDLFLEKAEETIERVEMVFDHQDGEQALLADQLRTEIEATHALPVSFVDCGKDFRALQIACLQKGHAAINLLQGAFGSGDGESGVIRRWAPLAWVVVICVALQIGFNLAAGYYFEHYASVGTKNMHDFYSRLFPDEKNIVDPRNQMEAKLLNFSGVKGQSGFSTLMGDAAAAYQAMGNPSSLDIGQFRYEARRGQLVMELTADSIAVLDTFKQHIVDAGLSAEILSASEEGNKINARMQIEGGS
ncbi:MAG: hypothetical protein KDI30_02215 [Pseudomonadales bacterium]|nr:hypothetical protein [Pseudomonadales bacterium]